MAAPRGRSSGIHGSNWAFHILSAGVVQALYMFIRSSPLKNMVTLRHVKHMKIATSNSKQASSRRRLSNANTAGAKTSTARGRYAQCVASLDVQAGFGSQLCRLAIRDQGVFAG